MCYESKLLKTIEILKRNNALLLSFLLFNPKFNWSKLVLVFWNNKCLDGGAKLLLWLWVWWLDCRGCPPTNWRWCGPWDG